MEQLKEFLPWAVGISGIVTGLIGSIFAIWQQYKKGNAETNAIERKAVSDATDETIRRLYAHLDRVERERNEQLDRVTREHNEDKAILAKLQEDYMVCRVELSRSRERCAYLETQSNNRSESKP